MRKREDEQLTRAQAPPRRGQVKEAVAETDTAQKVSLVREAKVVDLCKLKHENKEREGVTVRMEAGVT